VTDLREFIETEIERGEHPGVVLGEDPDERRQKARILRDVLARFDRLNAASQPLGTS
jgi:hypothetical protein